MQHNLHLYLKILSEITKNQSKNLSSDFAPANLLPYMLMRKQMFLAILIVSRAFGTKAEFERRVILLRPAADRALMLCNPGVLRTPDRLTERLPPVDLLWRIPVQIPRR